MAFWHLHLPPRYISDLDDAMEVQDDLGVSYED